VRLCAGFLLFIVDWGCVVTGGHNIDRYQGQTRTQWARKLGLSFTAFGRRVTRHGWEKAISAGGPHIGVIPTFFYTYQGETLSRKEWAAKIGISYDTLCKRIKAHGFDYAVQMGDFKGYGGISKLIKKKEVDITKIKKIKKSKFTKVIEVGLARGSIFCNYFYRIATNSFCSKCSVTICGVKGHALA
jgi:hypothetical protein